MTWGQGVIWMLKQDIDRGGEGRGFQVSGTASAEAWDMLGGWKEGGALSRGPEGPGPVKGWGEGGNGSSSIRLSLAEPFSADSASAQTERQAGAGRSRAG